MHPADYHLHSYADALKSLTQASNFSTDFMCSASCQATSTTIILLLIELCWDLQWWHMGLNGLLWHTGHCFCPSLEITRTTTLQVVLFTSHWGYCLACKTAKAPQFTHLKSPREESSSRLAHLSLQTKEDLHEPIKPEFVRLFWLDEKVPPEWHCLSLQILPYVKKTWILLEICCSSKGKFTFFLCRFCGIFSLYFIVVGVTAN